MRVAGFALTALIIELTPGPNMAYLASIGITEGRRSGFAAVFGTAGGLLVYGLVAAFGLTALIGLYPPVYEGLRWAGFAYLLWLAWDGWRDADNSAQSAPRTPPGAKTLAWRGFTVNVLNPKAGVFYVVVLPDFIDLAGKSVLFQNLTLVAIYVAIATAVHLLIVTGASSIGPWFLQGDSRERLLRRGMCLALAGVAIWLFIASAR